MWKQIEHYFNEYPQRKKIAQKMMEYGIRIHTNSFRCGEIELSDSKIARAFQVDRRAVTATRDVIKKEPGLLKIFSNLTPTCHLKDVAPHMNWGVIEIIPVDPSMPGILAQVASIIASHNISIRQAIVDDFEFSEEPRVLLTTCPHEGYSSTRRYKTGGARLAVRTGAFAVPIAVNSGELWPRNAFIRRPGTITVSIGPPIDSRGKSADEVAAAVESWIETEMRRLAPHRYNGPYVRGQGAATRAPGEGAA